MLNHKAGRCDHRMKLEDILGADAKLSRHYVVMGSWEVSTLPVISIDINASISTSGNQCNARNRNVIKLFARLISASFEAAARVGGGGGVEAEVRSWCGACDPVVLSAGDRLREPQRDISKGC